MSRVAQASRANRAAVIAGIGDDCAALRVPSGRDVLVTTDFSLEGVHFRREWYPPRSVGHRCLARGLSDIAAMGGKPTATFLSLALPSKLPQRWVDEFLRGLLTLAARFKVPLAGGDTAASHGGIVADIIVVGSVPHGKAVMRSGARPGDRIYVTGSLGGSATALSLLARGQHLTATAFPAHFRPMPRIDVGQVLREKGVATAMIDVSDGLSTDLSHICEASGVGAEICEQRVPLAEVGKPRRPVAMDLALHGGEDYELLFTARPNKRIPRAVAGVPLTCIGEITRPKKVFLIRSSGERSVLQPRGWEHFRKALNR